MSLTLALKRKLLQHTGFFETGKSTMADAFKVIAGNYDGQGMSFGPLQCNFGQSSLQPWLKNYIGANGTEFTTAFGATKAATFKDVLNNKTVAQQIAWADSISTTDRKKLISEWETVFSTIGAKTTCQDSLINTSMVTYVDRALSLATKFGITTTQGLAYLFDMAVNSYSFTISEAEVKAELDERVKLYLQVEGKDMPDFDRLYILKKYDRNPTRRETIRQGSGSYLGHTYNISTYGLDYSTKF